MRKKLLMCLLVVAVATISFALVACGGDNIQDVLEESALDSALSNSTITYVEEADGDTDQTVYKLADGIFYTADMEEGQVADENYYAEIDGRYYHYYYNDMTESWDRNDVSEQFATYRAPILRVFNALKADFFEKDGEYYVMKPTSYVEYIARTLGVDATENAEMLNDFAEKVDYIKIKIVNNQLVELVMQMKETEEDEEGESTEYTIKYTYGVSYGGVSLTLPEIEQTEEE